MSRKYYRIRAFPNHQDRFADFVSEEYIGIAWPEIGNIKDSSKENILKELSEHYPELTNRALALTRGFFTRLLEMSIGDIILIPYYKENLILIGEVTKPYYFEPESIEDHTAHRVGFKEIKRLTINDLSEGLKRSIDTIATVISLDRYGNIIEELIKDKQLVIQKGSKQSFSLDSNGKQIELYISGNVTKDDLIAFINKI